VTGLQLYIDFIVFALGAVVGSFLNVCITGCLSINPS